MIRRSGLLLTVAAAMLLACIGVALAQAPATPAPLQQVEIGRIQDHYIVVLKDNVGDQDVEQNARHDPERVASEMSHGKEPG